MHRRDRIVGEQQIVLRISATRRAAAALVIDENANSPRGELSLQGEVDDARLMLRAVDQDDDRHLARALGQNEPPGEIDASASEPRIGDVERNALAGNFGETDRPRSQSKVTVLPSGRSVQPSVLVHCPDPAGVSLPVVPSSSRQRHAVPSDGPISRLRPSARA